MQRDIERVRQAAKSAQKRPYLDPVRPLPSLNGYVHQLFVRRESVLQRRFRCLEPLAEVSHFDRGREHNVRSRDEVTEPRTELRRGNASNMLKIMRRVPIDPLTGVQCKMARAGLGLSIEKTAKLASVSRASIVRFESGIALKPTLQLSLRAALEDQGAAFIPDGVKVIRSEVA